LPCYQRFNKGDKNEAVAMIYRGLEQAGQGGNKSVNKAKKSCSGYHFSERGM